MKARTFTVDKDGQAQVAITPAEADAVIKRLSRQLLRVERHQAAAAQRVESLKATHAQLTKQIADAKAARGKIKDN